MVSGIILHLPQTLTETSNLRSNPLPAPAISRRRFPTRISCSRRKKLSDTELAMDFATEVAKITANSRQREDAMKKGGEFLFTELCGFLSLKSEEMKRKWKQMEEEAKWKLVENFVSEWGVHFQPLSLRSVKEMVEEHVNGENESVNSPVSSLIPGLKRIIGL